MSILRRNRQAATADKPPTSVSQSRGIYGLVAEFEDPEVLVEAMQRTYDAGYRKMDAYTPFPVHGLAEAMGRRGIRLPLMVLAGGILGGVGGFLLQYYGAAIDYPLNIGGRPLNSWPAFIPITFETTVLGAVFSAVFGMLALNGLPAPYHPIFNAPNFELASRSHFFLCIEAVDPKYDTAETRRFLESLRPNSVAEVER
jgi:hypothetical protein